MAGRATSGVHPEPDRGQFEALYLQHHAFVGRCLARWGVAPASLDDARQDVFLTAYRRMHTLDDHASMRAWLAGISRRIAWRHRRTRERHDRRVDALAKIHPEVISLDDWVRTREAQAVLGAFVDALDPPKREAFVLCELEGLSAREAAHATGVNQATLYSRLRVARSSFATMCASLETAGIVVEPEQAASIHRRSQPADSRAAMRGWMLLVPKLATLGASTALVAKPMLVAAIVLGGIGVSATVVLHEPDPTPTTPVVRASASALEPAPIERSEPVRARTAPPEPRVDEPPSSPPAKPKPSHPKPAPTPEDLAAQVELLGVAEAHLGRGASKEALEAATSHLASWPHGPLARDAVRVAVRAQCAVGERPAAVALVRTHLAGIDADAWVDRRCGKNDGSLQKSEPAGD